MIKILYIFGIIFLFAAAMVSAQTADAAAGYGSLSDYLDSIYGADENTGLTAFPILNIPLGGRSEGMASAFGAVADDISFLEYNPAGSSMLSRSELAFFHNNWIADTKIEGAVFASRLKDFGFAAGAKWLYTPFTEYSALGSRVSKGYYSEAEAVLNGSYNFLPGYYFSGISLGINLKGVFRFVPDYTEDDVILSGSGSSQSAAMVMADLGALTRFNFLKFYDAREQNASAALTVRNLGPPAKDEPLPTAFSAALSYKPLRPLLFSFDLSFPLNTQNPAFSEKPYWAVGTALDISAFLSMRMGFLYKAGNFRFAVGSAVNLQKISLDFNYSLDLMTQLQSLNRVSVGIRFDLGDQGRRQKAAQVDTLYLQGLEAYAQGNYQEALFYFEEALKLSPRFDPAREALETIRRSLEVEERINNLQRLDFVP
jgi:tetratricopeptide (TPR) repeat protein